MRARLLPSTIGNFYNTLYNTKVTASICAFFVSFVLTCRSGNRRVSFPFGSQQQANEALRHDLPRFRLKDCDIWAGLSFLLMGFVLLEQLFCRQPPPSSPTALEAQHDAQKAVRQPVLAGP